MTIIDISHESVFPDPGKLQDQFLCLKTVCKDFSANMSIVSKWRIVASKWRIVNDSHLLVHRSLFENIFTYLPNSYLPLQEGLMKVMFCMYEHFTTEWLFQKRLMLEYGYQWIPLVLRNHLSPDINIWHIRLLVIIAWHWPCETQKFGYTSSKQWWLWSCKYSFNFLTTCDTNTLFVCTRVSLHFSLMNWARHFS